MDVYNVLADVYKTIGLNETSEQLRARVFDHIQSEGWLGRRVLELGCGVGVTAEWFSTNGLRVTAVDRSEAMIAIGQASCAEKGLSVDWRQEDYTEMSIGNGYDLVIAMNTFNEVRRTSSLEKVFAGANNALATGKLFVFDLMTYQGLVDGWGNADRVLYDEPDSLMLVARSHFSLETSLNTRHIVLYRQQDDAWSRNNATLTYRGYALQSVGSVLRRTGFKVLELLTDSLESYDPNDVTCGQVVFVAVKERDI